MGKDENWIKGLREAGRVFESAPVQGLWEELEGELLAGRVVRRSIWGSRMWYVAASLMVAAVATIIICGYRNQEIAPVLTIFTSAPSVEEDLISMIDDGVEPPRALNEQGVDGNAMVSISESAEMPGAKPENEGCGKFSYYERIIVVESGADPMNNECVLVKEGTDVKAPDNISVGNGNHHRGIGGRLYGSASGAKLSGGTPISAGASVDIPVADRLRLETGLEYTAVRAGGVTESYLGIPVKLNYDICEGDRMRVYASAGGVVDKSLDRRDVSVGLTAGAGIECFFDDDWGVFIEPGVEYRPGNGGSGPVGAEVRVGFRHTFR